MDIAAVGAALKAALTGPTAPGSTGAAAGAMAGCRPCPTGCLDWFVTYGKDIPSISELLRCGALDFFIKLQEEVGEGLNFLL